MQTRSEEAGMTKSASPAISAKAEIDEQYNLVIECLEDAKAEDIITIDLEGKSSIGDYMIVASGRSHRHVGAIADRLGKHLREHGYGRSRIEGQENCDWVLLDAGGIIIHVFRPEVREFYNIEKMWLAERPEDTTEQ
ncbi:MAG: ribosomal silencing factor RsfS [Rhodomicrobium sp.]|nr:MAG: ribosomal silencing factor RsfS [Rhodomicrobium sp.]